MRSLESIEHLLDGRTFERVLGAYDYELRDFFRDGSFDLKKQVVVFSHNTPGYRILCDDWGDEILIHHNHYMTSFLDNLALTAMAPQVAEKHGVTIEHSTWDLCASLARKFFAEQMFEIADSHMARVVFLDNLIAFDRHFRPIFGLRQTDERLQKSSSLCTAMASDFLLHHELGHVVSRVGGFDPFVKEALQYAETVPGYREWSTVRQRRFLDESAADVLALTVVMKVYAELASEKTLRAYIKFLIHAVTRMEVLYCVAADAHRQNVDSAYDCGDIDAKFEEWSGRLAVMDQYTTGVRFGADTVLPLDQDDCLSMASDEDLQALTTTNFSAPISEDTRRLAEAISFGFENGAGFKAVLDATRMTRVLERRG